MAHGTQGASRGRKSITRARDALSRKRRELPWEKVEKTYVFEGPNGAINTYSCYGRGLDILIGAYNFLDLVPKGRDEDGLPYGMAWVRHHDRYDGAVRSNR